MIEIIDGGSFETLGIEIQGDERHTAGFAIDMYLKHLTAYSQADKDGVLLELLSYGEMLAEDAKDRLTTNERTVLAGAESEFCILALKLLAKMHSSCPTNLYEAMARSYEIKTVDMLWHGITATQMLDPTEIETRLLSPTFKP